VPDSIEESKITLRDIETAAELKSVEALQKEAWGCSDLDVAPLTILLASREVGATLIGAFDGSSLIGFVYGFPGYEHDRPIHHSHMLAVKPAYRNRRLGFKLKLAQRERVLARHIVRITWTFDPLQSVNAHLNFARLGVMSDTYKVDFYGAATSSVLHQIGTDRLWVTWLIDSQGVRDRLHAVANNRPTAPLPESARPLVRVSDSLTPERSESAGQFVSGPVSIEIPWDINALQHEQPKLAGEWRAATRWAFQQALASNYIVTDFYRVQRGDGPIGVYLLRLRE
jgi:chorismate synthase